MTTAVGFMTCLLGAGIFAVIIGHIIGKFIEDDPKDHHEP